MRKAVYTIAGLCIASAALLSLNPALSQDEAPLSPGTKAPAFKTTAVNKTPISLAALKGHVVLLDFWATWCGPCRMATPTFQRLHQRFAAKGLRVVGINVDDSSSVDQVKPFIKQFGITYTVAANPDADVNIAQAYHATGLPSQYLIDKRGIVRWSQSGYDPDEGPALAAKIKKLLAEK